ncbi:odorant receptor 59a-like [Drosophila innubila]|uniref:odorant receptor 59a-like n=1 Tax=Drosophila innubila TaxID=198719 RepID=UPI00148DCEDB|nr:odorant receptor 59a-like [Drosophila innubila]
METNSLTYFNVHWIIWNSLGYGSNYVIWRPLLIVYIVLLHLAFNVGYSFHLGMSIFHNDNFTDDIKNLTTFAVCFAGTLKSLVYAFNFYKIHQMEQMLNLLDSRVSGKEETNIYINLRTQLRNILYGFIGIYMTVGIFAELSFAFQDKRGLMYPAWFPFDWRNSTRNFYIAHVYQLVGIAYHLIQNFAFDSYPAMILCLISAHIQILYARFEQIGLNDRGDAEAQNQLEACITDHKCLLQLFKTMESLFSLPMLIQFTVTAMNVCISIAAFLFFVTDPMGRSYFLFYSMGVPFQIFPTCYYGTDTEFWFGKLHYAAFSCNWTTQSRSFKKKLMLFVECSLKQNTPMAGGMLRIHVATFFSTLKFAYSLFTILLQMQK